MIRVKLDLSGKDSTFLSNIHRYYNGLAACTLFRTRQDLLEQLKGAIDHYANTYEGGVNGDRVQIARRRAAREQVEDLFKKILHYVQSVASEENIPELLQAGFDLHRSHARKKAVVAPA